MIYTIDIDEEAIAEQILESKKMEKYSDSTLRSFSKRELIDIIRILEMNLDAYKEMNNNQYNLLLTLYKERTTDDE